MRNLPSPSIPIPALTLLARVKELADMPIWKLRSERRRVISGAARASNYGRSRGSLIAEIIANWIDSAERAADKSPGTFWHGKIIKSTDA